MAYDGQATGWTPERAETALKLWGEGQSAKEIMNFLNSSTGACFTPSAIIGKLHRMGAPRRRTNVVRKGSSRTRKPENPTATHWRRSAKHGSHISVEAPLKSASQILNREPEAGGISFNDWNPNSCRWVFDDGTLCGSKRHGVSYCKAHHKRAYPAKERATKAAQMSQSTTNGERHG